MVCLPQPGSVPAAFAVAAAGCDWPLPHAVSLQKSPETLPVPLIIVDQFGRPILTY